MDKYEENEICTVWFVVFDDGQTKRIVGYSDEKEYVEAYIALHKCKNMKVKKLTDRADRMFDIINENANDEIGIYNLIVRSNSKKKGHETKTIVVPMTHTEAVFVNDEGHSMMMSRIDYSWINSAKDFLKDKYRKALKDIFLDDCIKHVIYNKSSTLVQTLALDQLSLLFRSFPDYFG